jgi:thiosulfate/3-mercaptopyruvate sulfurtransferase
MNLPGPLVSVDWLEQNLRNPRLVILESVFANPMNRSAEPPEGDGLGIPGAVEVDLEEDLSDPDSPLPHTVLPADEFTEVARACGVNNDSLVVVYDRLGIFSSARVRWNFLFMGHAEVAVLDGGLPAWKAKGLPTAPLLEVADKRGTFSARPRPELIADAEKVAAALQDSTCAVLDARSEGRFYGEQAEPRAGLRGGHMPNAFNLPFDKVLQLGKMKDKNSLAELFRTRIGARQRLFFTCGSGVTACIIGLAAEIAGYQNPVIYDGSWSEWGLPESGRPVVSGRG